MYARCDYVKNVKYFEIVCIIKTKYVSLHSESNEAFFKARGRSRITKRSDKKMENQIEIGYTLTDCYSANANFKGQQKQIVLKVDGKITNVFVDGFVNRPADSDRYQSFIKLADFSSQDLDSLKKISKDHKFINWNTGKYTVYTYDSALTKKQKQAVRDAECAYIKILADTIEPLNKKNELKTKKAIKKIIKKYLPKQEYKTIDSFIYGLPY